METKRTARRLRLSHGTQVQEMARYSHTHEVDGERISLSFSLQSSHPCCPRGSGQLHRLPSGMSSNMVNVLFRNREAFCMLGFLLIIYGRNPKRACRRHANATLQAPGRQPTLAHSYPSGNQTKGLLAVRQQCKHLSICRSDILICHVLFNRHGQFGH